MNNESMGAAETIVQSLLSHADHMYHNRPGVVVADARFKVGVRWEYVTHREKCRTHEDDPVRPEKDAEGKKTGRLLCSKCQSDVRGNGHRIVYRKVKVGKKEEEQKVGYLGPDGKDVLGPNGQKVAEYREAGIFPEIAVWMYEQVAKVWELDNEFAARWASHAFGEDHKDRAVIMAAFMLVQSRKGDPVREDGKVLFHDDDFRDVGEAMVLHLKDKRKKDEREISPRMLLRIHEVLSLDGIAAVNRRLGFGVSARRPPLGRWAKAVEKWLLYREENPKMLEGLVKSGQKSTVVELCKRVGYKPASPRFFEILGVRQKQAPDGRRTVAIGLDIRSGGSWEGMSEEQICEAIVRDKVGYKRVAGMVPRSVGVTRAVMAATIEAGGVSDKEMIILMPTLEELGLLDVPSVKERIERAVKGADDMRAANVAARMRSQEAKEKLQEASDNALKKAVEEVMKDMRAYILVDKSGSMEGAIEAAKGCVTKFLQGFPPERVHVAYFDAVGREVRIPHPSAAGVAKAFSGITAGGGTNYGQGVLALRDHVPKDEEDVVMIFIGDEGHGIGRLIRLGEGDHPSFAADVQRSGLRPMAFGLIPIVSKNPQFPRGNSVRKTAAELGIPCFEIGEETFADPYAIPRTIRNIIAATPVTARATAAPVRRQTLVEVIMKTELLRKPAWAA